MEKCRGIVMDKVLKFIIIPLSTFLIGMMVGKYIEKSNHICQEIIISDTLEENVAETTQTIVEPCEKCKGLDAISVTNQNPYFFTEEGEYKIESIVSETDMNLLYGDDLKLSVKAIRHFQEGFLYSIQIVGASDDCYIYNNVPERLHLGYFYVTAEKIYWLEAWQVCAWEISEREFMKQAIVVLQEEDIENVQLSNPENPNVQTGWYEKIETVNKRKIYDGQQKNASGDIRYRLGFEWEKEKGLVEYRCGINMFFDYIHIQTID